MTISDAWSAYMALLRDRAPITAASIRPPRPVAERKAAEDATTLWSDELREFYALHDGQQMPGGGYWAGSALPTFVLVPLEEVVRWHKNLLDSPHSIDDLGEDWPVIIRAQQAGETAHMFIPSYVPFAEEGADSSILYVDTRDGTHHGCVRHFAADSADEGSPAYPSLSDYIETVRRSLEHGTEHQELMPIIEDGILNWEYDLPEAPPQPPPTVIYLPFAPTDFRPSQVNDGDDLVDLAVVERTVIDTARSLHPGSVVEGARAVYRRLPRQRGANMNWWVQVDGAETVFTVFATGTKNDVLVIEIPTGPVEFEVVEW
ncbi:SMI1/KNR4 family protein [Actinomycetes bacterium M1A6_2h]